MIEAKISVQRHGNETYPMLISLPSNGCDSHNSIDNGSSSSKKEDKFNNTPVIISRQIIGKTSKTIVSCAVEAMKLRGTDFGEFSSKKDCCKFAIGIYDEKKRKIKMISSANHHIYVMKPVVTNSQNNKQDNTPRNSSVLVDAVSRRQSLNEEFGSRKKKKALQAIKNNIILSENIVGRESMGKAK